MGTVQIILLILGVVEPMLASQNIIPQQYQGLAQGILNAVNAIKADLTGPSGKLTVTAVAATQAVASGLAALESAGALPKVGGGISVALADAAAAGAAAYVEAGQQVDPTKLQPIAPAK